MEKKNKKYFPIFVDLMDRKIVVVGAGTIAKRRIRALVDFTEHLYVIAPEVNPELRDLDAAGRLTIIRRKYEKGDICGASFVIAATNDNRLNQEIYAGCKEAGIPVNVCNDKTRCDFYFPVLAYDDTIVAGVSSAGHDAAGSKRVANQIREMLRETEKTAEPVQQAAGTVEAVTERSCDTIGQDADAPGSVEKVITQKAAGKVRIFTDGAARGNPDGPGGYGVILQYTDAAGELHERQFSQGYVKTTNNRMELMAAIVGLEALKRPCEIELYSDSQYLIKAFNEHWLDGWIKKNWMRNKTDPVKNVDLWKRLLAAAGPHRITWNWVKGHDGHPENERCDQLATGAADGEDLIEDVVQAL